MKRFILPLLALLILAAGCGKQLPKACLKAKLVRVTCAGKVFQVLNDQSIGQDNWKDIFSSNTYYDNVFTVSNSCSLPSEYKVDDVVYLTIEKAAEDDCVRCALFDAPPAVSYKIKTIGSLPCNGQD